MILFHAKRDGTVTTKPDLIPQGSSMQDLVVVSEFAYAYCAIRLLPASGEYIEDIPCDMILKKDGTIIWTASLPPKATVVAGSVDYQLIFTAADGATQTTLVGSFTVPRGVPVSTPPTVGELSSKTVADLYNILNNISALFAGHEGDITKSKTDIAKNKTDITKNTANIAQNKTDIAKNKTDITKNTANIAQNKTDIAALKKTISSAGYVTIPVTEWEDGSPTIATFILDGFGKGMSALLIPADSNTQTAAREARLSAFPDIFRIDDDTQTVEIIRANADKAPEIPLRFAYMILKTSGTTVAPSVAIIGVDAYGEGGGAASGVDETAVRAIITAMLGNVANERQYSASNPPPYPVTSVNGKTGAVSLTIPSKAADVGADPAGTASSKLITHNADTVSHQDIRLMIKEHEDAVNALLNSDDETLNETKEIVAYIKSNKSLIDAITTSKVNVSDIINNLTTNVTNKPLSAAQGVALKLLIDSLENVVEGKTTPDQVAAQIKTALDPYITKDVADKTYQPKGNYLTPDTGDQRYAKPTDIPTVPTKLPNPNPLTINGKTYDGSSPVEVTVEGGNGVADTVDIFLNDEDVAVVGHEYNLYHYAVVHGKKPYTEYDIAVILSYVDDNGKTVNVAANNYKECFRFTPTEARDYSLTYLVREIKCADPKNEYIAKKTITLHVIEDTTVSGKKVLFIGDSFTDAGYWPAEIQHNLSGGGITSIGTRTDTVTIGDQSLTVLHEGREGWATWDYAGTSASMTSKFSSEANVFRNPSTNKFDLAYYMEQNHPGVTLNAVCVFLGTNGLGAITSVVNGMTEMIARIREYDATVPILLHYTIQNVGQDYWSKLADQKNCTKWCRQHLWREQYGEYKRLYSGMDNVYIVPVYENLDYDLDFPHKEFAASARNPATISRVTDGHPAKVGYLKMADVYYAYLLRYMREGGEVEEPDEPDEPDEPTVSYTNLADPSKTSANPSTALSADQWLNGHYISNKAISTKADLVVTNKIPMSASDTIRIKGFAVEGTIGGSNCKSRFRLLPCKSDGTALISEVYPAVDQATQGTGYLDYMDAAELANGVYCFCPNDTEKASYWANVAFVRICGYPIDGDNSNVIVTVNEPIA